MPNEDGLDPLRDHNAQNPLIRLLGARDGYVPSLGSGITISPLSEAGYSRLLDLFQTGFTARLATKYLDGIYPLAEDLDYEVSSAVETPLTVANIAGGTVVYYDPESEAGQTIDQTVIVERVGGLIGSEGWEQYYPGLNEWTDAIYADWLWLLVFVQRGAGLLIGGDGTLPNTPPSFQLPPYSVPYYPPYVPPGQPYPMPPGGTPGPVYPAPPGTRPDGSGVGGDTLVQLEECEIIIDYEYGSTFFDLDGLGDISGFLEQKAINSGQYDPETEKLVSVQLETVGKTYKLGTYFHAPPFTGQLEAFKPDQAWIIQSGVPSRDTVVPRNEEKLFGIELGNDLGAITFVNFVYPQSEIWIKVLPQGSPVFMKGWFIRFPLLFPAPLADPQSAFARMLMCAFVKRSKTPATMNEVYIRASGGCDLYVHSGSYSNDWTNMQGGSQVYDGTTGIKTTIARICLGFHLGYGAGAKIGFNQEEWKAAQSDLIDGEYFGVSGTDGGVAEQFYWANVAYGTGNPFVLSFSSVLAIRVAIVAIQFTNGDVRYRNDGPVCEEWGFIQNPPAPPALPPPNPFP